MSSRFDIVLKYIFLPCDVKRIIKNYCCNILGYTGEDLTIIKYESNKARGKKLRTLVEAMHFKKMGVSTNWLKSFHHQGLLYSNGAYLSSFGEIKTIEQFYRNGEISREQSTCIYEEIYDHVSIGMKCEIQSIMKRMYPDYYFFPDSDGRLTNTGDKSVYDAVLKRRLSKL